LILLIKLITNVITAGLNSAVEGVQNSGLNGHPHPLTPQYYLAELATTGDIEVLVSQQDFNIALCGLVPSVSQSEMDHYNHVQHQFSQDVQGIPFSEGEDMGLQGM
jgi:hypothetical protein